MNIRQEEPGDYEAVARVVEAAFQNAEHSDGKEHELVAELRKGEGFVPALSLVAETEREIVGHILFTEAKINDNVVLALAPLSVLPKYQKQGIGKALIREGHKRAKKLGYSYSVVLGSEKYYPKLGYLPADIFGIIPPFDVPCQNFMAYKIDEAAPCLNGMLRYAKAFGI